jgi:hypothetical protein
MLVMVVFLLKIKCLRNGHKIIKIDKLIYFKLEWEKEKIILIIWKINQIEINWQNNWNIILLRRNCMLKETDFISWINLR